VKTNIRLCLCIAVYCFTVLTIFKVTNAQATAATKNTNTISCKQFLSPGNTKRIALVQYSLVGALTYERFLEKVKSYLRLSKDNGAQIVVLPELIAADLINLRSSESDIISAFNVVARNITETFFSDIKEIAEQMNLIIVGGSFPRLVNGHIRNTSPIAIPRYPLVLQDKVYLTPSEIRWGWQNGDVINVVNSDLGKLVVLICHDAEFPNISVALSRYQPELLLVPSMTETVHGFHRVRWTGQARAIEQRSYVAITGTVSADKEDYFWPNYSQSVVVTPAEDAFQTGVLAEGDVNENQIVIVDLNFEKLREVRQTNGVWPARDFLARTTDFQINEINYNQ
jgi:predicted amidohydrolase